jgi:ribokinase
LTAASADVVVVGSLNLDLVVTSSRLPSRGETVLAGDIARHPGGKGLNQAIAAARQGASVAMVGVVGADAEGDALLDVADREGIDTSGVGRVEDVASGLAVITVDAAGDNTIVVAPGANRALTVEHVRSHLDGLREGAVVLAQLEVPVDAVVAAMDVARAAGARTVLNPAPAGPLPPDLLARCDLIVPNETEAAALTGVDTGSDDGVAAAARRLVAEGAGAAVVTIGARGACWVTDGEAPVRIPTFRVSAVDVTAAGDAFCGALAAALARGNPMPVALRRAAAAGALATTTPGAVPSLPRAADVEDLLRTP